MGFKETSSLTLKTTSRKMLDLKLFVAIIWTLKTLLTILLATLILIGIMPLILIISCPFHIYRKILFYSAKYLKPSLGKMLTTRSALLASEDLYNDPRNTLINATVFEGTISLEVIRKVFKEKAIDALDPLTGELLFPELQQNITFWMGYPFWKDVKNYKLEEHVHYYKGLRTDNNNEFSRMSKSEAITLIKQLSLKPFRKDRAICEVIVIPNYEPEPIPDPNLDPNLKYSLIIFKQHHALADGYSNYKLLEHFSLSKFNFVKAHDYTQKEKYKSRSAFKRFLFNLGLVFQMPFDVAQYLVSAPNSQTLWKLNSFNDDKKCDAGNTVSCAVSKLITFSDIKEIGNLHKVSGTSILIAAITGAIRNVMFSKVENIPKKINLAVPLPLPGHPNKLRNYATGTSILLPLSENDILKRLQIIHERIQWVKKSSCPIAFSLLSVLGGATPSWMVPQLKKLAKKRQSIFLTNFAGPIDPMEMFGHPVKGLCVFSGMVKDTQIIMMTFVTVGGYGKLTVGADRAVIPNDRMAQKIVEEFFSELERLRKIGFHQEIV